MGVKGTGVGPKISEFLVGSDEASNTLENELNRLLKDGVLPDSITILSPLSYEASLVSTLSDQLKNKVIKLDDYSIRSFPVKGISFSKIKDFKGLENEVIIVIDLLNPPGIHDVTEKVQYYVAMSRARGLLSIIWMK